MIKRGLQRIFDRLFDASLVTIMGLPPKDPQDDGDENEDDEEDDDEEDEEPAVVREPDECRHGLGAADALPRDVSV